MTMNSANLRRNYDLDQLLPHTAETVGVVVRQPVKVMIVQEKAI